jgi:DMSO/TMAO reductase YedYZ molybdopterin-dependent catalytic subunit
LAALIAIVGSALVAALVGGPPPLEPLAALVMEWTPVPLANALLDLLGPLGKPLALWGAAAIVLAAGGPLALLAYRGPFGRLDWPLTIAVVLAAGWLLAKPSAPLGAAVLAGLFLAALAARARLVAVARETGSARRRFLIGAVVNVGAVAFASAVPLIGSWARAATIGRSGRPALFPFTPPEPRATGFSIAGLTSEVTPLPAFYRMSKNVADPVVDESVWSLTVAGRVGRTLSLTLDDLAGLPRTDQYTTMQCVSNPVGGPLWSAALFSGVRLGELLQRAEPSPDVRWVSFEAPDGHREQLSLDRALDPRVMVAYAMNGEWLLPEHGFPARLLATGLYGFRSVKWLGKIELLAEPRPGHWEERQWTAAEIHTTARVDVARPEPGGALVAGVAFAGTRGVRSVEARVNGGPWQPADLHLPPLSDSMWVQWRARVALPPGESRVEARAIDGAGAAQDETARGQFPNGATGLHGLAVPG